MTASAHVNPQLWWYVARSGGLVAWWCASLSVLWGLALSTRLIRKKGVPAWLLASHRYLGALTVVFTAIHVGGLIADSYVEFSLVDVLVPFASTWRPGAVAWGIVAFYVLIAVEVSSLLMRRLPRRVWHAIHLSSFGVFLMGTAHAFTAGSDADNAAVQWTGFVLGAAFLFLFVFRQLSSSKAKSTRPSRSSAGSSPVQSTTVDGEPSQTPPSTTTDTDPPKTAATA